MEQACEAVSIGPCDPGGQKDPKDQTIDEQNFLPDFSPEVAVRLGCKVHQ